MSRNLTLQLIIAVSFVAGSAAVCHFAPSAKSGEAGVIRFLPESVGEYRGTPVTELSPAEVQYLPSDTQFAKMTYRPIGVSHGAFDINASLIISGGDQRSLHRPEVCLKGQGWRVKSKLVRTVSIKGFPLEITDLGIEQTFVADDGAKSTIRAHYLYWWVGKNVSTPSTFERKVIALKDNFFRNINHRWAYPSFMAAVAEFPDRTAEENDRATLERIEALMQDVVPLFQESFRDGKRSFSDPYAVPSLF